MADTFGDLVTEIVDETRRSMSTQIETCIQAAIAHYEVERFFFNWTRTTTFSLSSSQAYYTSVDNSMIPRFMDIDRITMTVNSTFKPTLNKRTWGELEDYDTADTFTSEPTAWAYSGQSLRFDPTPDGGYEVRVAGISQLASLSVSTDTNAWVQRGNGRELVKQRAKMILYSQYLRDDANAGRAAGLEQHALEKLLSRTSRLFSSGAIVPCL